MLAFWRLIFVSTINYKSFGFRAVVRLVAWVYGNCGVRLRESWGIPLFRTLRSGAALPLIFYFFYSESWFYFFYFPVLRCNFVSDVFYFVSDVFSLVLRVVIRVVVFWSVTAKILGVCVLFGSCVVSPYVQSRWDFTKFGRYVFLAAYCY